MIPIEQQLFYNEETGERGDCLKCCLASLLELPYEEVPHFVAMGDRWFIEEMNWLASRNWQIFQAFFTVDENDPTKLSGYTVGYWLAGVTSLRTRSDGSHISHMVVMKDNEIAFDPHPDRAQGHLGFETGEILIPVDPARFTLKEEFGDNA